MSRIINYLKEKIHREQPNHKELLDFIYRVGYRKRAWTTKAKLNNTHLYIIRKVWDRGVYVPMIAKWKGRKWEVLLGQMPNVKAKVEVYY